MGVYAYEARGRRMWAIDEYLQLSDGSFYRFRKRRIPTRRKAEDLLRRRIAEAFDGRFFPDRKEDIATVEEAWELFLPHSKRKKSSWQTDVGRANHLLRHLGERRVARLTPRDIEDYYFARSGEKTVRGGPPAVSTVNREVALLRRMINYAVRDCRLLRSNPILDMRLEPENNQRDVIISPAQFERLLEAAEPPLKPILLVAHDTGLRRRSILQLRWSQVDLGGDRGRIKLDAEDVKRHAGIPTVVLTKRTAEAIGSLPRSLSGFVFVNPKTNQPWNDIRKLFGRARRKAGLPSSLWFHDLRAAFVVNARRAGVDDKTIRSMTGHKSLAAYDRYNRLDASDQQRAIEMIEGACKPAAGESTPEEHAESTKASGGK
ncbi:MAG: site-specific integrase [Polyangia bacterium]